MTDTITPTYTTHDSVTTVPVESIKVGSWVFMSNAGVMACAAPDSPTRRAHRVVSVRSESVDGLGIITYVGVESRTRCEMSCMPNQKITIPA